MAYDPNKTANLKCHNCQCNRDATIILYPVGAVSPEHGKPYCADCAIRFWRSGHYDPRYAGKTNGTLEERHEVMKFTIATMDHEAAELARAVAGCYECHKTECPAHPSYCASQPAGSHPLSHLDETEVTKAASDMLRSSLPYDVDLDDPELDYGDLDDPDLDLTELDQEIGKGSETDQETETETDTDTGTDPIAE